MPLQTWQFVLGNLDRMNDSEHKAQTQKMAG